MMNNCIKHSQLTLIANLGGATYWSQFDAMPTSINSDREPGGGLS
jgi:hypothetical protein